MAARPAHGTPSGALLVFNDAVFRKPFHGVGSSGARPPLGAGDNGVYAAALLIASQTALAADAYDQYATGQPPEGLRSMPSLVVPAEPLPPGMRREADVPTLLEQLSKERTSLEPKEQSLSTLLQRETRELREAKENLTLYRALDHSMARFLRAAGPAELAGVGAHLRRCARVYESPQQWIAPRLHGCFWRTGRLQARLLCANNSASPHARAFGCELGHVMSEFLLHWIVKEKNPRLQAKRRNVGRSFQASVRLQEEAVASTRSALSQLAARQDAIDDRLTQLHAINAQLSATLDAQAAEAARVGLARPKTRSLLAVQEWTLETARRARRFGPTLGPDLKSTVAPAGKALSRNADGRCLLKSAGARALLTSAPFDDRSSTHEKEGVPCEEADFNGDGVTDYLLRHDSRNAALAILRAEGTIESLQLITGPGFGVVPADPEASEGATAHVALGGAYVSGGSAVLRHGPGAKGWSFALVQGEDLDKTVSVADALAEGYACREEACMGAAEKALESESEDLFRCVAGEAEHCLPAAAAVAAMLDATDPVQALAAFDSRPGTDGNALSLARRLGDPGFELCEDQPRSAMADPVVKAACAVQDAANGLAVRSGDADGIAWLRAALLPRVVARLRPAMWTSIRLDFDRAFEAEHGEEPHRTQFIHSPEGDDPCVGYRSVSLHIADAACRGDRSFQDDVLLHVANQELESCRLDDMETLFHEVLVEDLPAHQLSNPSFRVLPISAVKRQLCTILTDTPEVHSQLEAMRTLIRLRIVLHDTITRAMCMDEDLLEAPEPWVQAEARHHAVRCEALALMDHALYQEAFDAGLFFTVAPVLQRFWRESLSSSGATQQCRQLRDAFEREDTPHIREAVEALGDGIRQYPGGLCQYLIEAALGAARAGPLAEQP